jgi:cell division protein FtsA
MMDKPIVVGIDIGSNKICTLVGQAEANGQIRILGMGLEPAEGMRKGVVIDLAAASQAVARSVDKAEHTAGLEITSALVSLAGASVSSINSRGVVGVSGRVIDENDILRAIDAARAVAIPHNREIIHVIQRGFKVDEHEGIHNPLGMHGYRLEVETHIITAAAGSVENLRECVASANVDVKQFVLNPLASAEVALNETERQIGVAVCDIGGGTSDMAIYIDGDIWHTAVLPVGGNYVTSDIAHGLRLPLSQAEDVKLAHGFAIADDVDKRDNFQIKPFGEGNPVQISRQELAHIIEARIEEIFSMVSQEIKRSGYNGLLPAGMVITGGTSMLPGIRDLAGRVLGVPVRIAKPQNLVGMSDRLETPAYATTVGLLRWALNMNDIASFVDGDKPIVFNSGGEKLVDKLKRYFKLLIP